MNILVLDSDPELAARYHCDVHVVSQLKEGAQIMSTVCHLLGVKANGIYDATHPQHPAVKWAAAAWGNLEWLLMLCFALNKEYSLRRVAKGKQAAEHKSFDVAATVWSALTRSKKVDLKVKMTEHVQVMPVAHRVKGDPVKAYRTYYVAEKLWLRNSKGVLVPAEWTEHGPPAWVPKQPVLERTEPAFEDLF